MQRSLPGRLENALEEQELELAFAQRRTLRRGELPQQKPGGVKLRKVLLAIERKDLSEGLKGMRPEKLAGPVCVTLQGQTLS